MHFRKTFTAVLKKQGRKKKWQTEARTKRQARRIFERRLERNDSLSNYRLSVRDGSLLTPTRKGLAPWNKR